MDSQFNKADLLDEEGETTAAAALFAICAEGYAVAYGADHSETAEARQRFDDCQKLLATFAAGEEPQRAEPH